MAQLDVEKIKKAERGELIGNIASAFCFVIFIYFIVMFSLSWATDNGLLKIIMWSTATPLMAAGIAIAAYCNLKYGSMLEREIKRYAIAVFVENAGLMHPEKDSLTFNFNVVGKSVEITVNGYKEKIVFDFSELKRFGGMRKLTATKIISDRLSATFCRLFERGASYKTVVYRRAGKNGGKTIAIITDGMPDKNIMKNYLKNR